MTINASIFKTVRSSVEKSRPLCVQRSEECKLLAPPAENPSTYSHFSGLTPFPLQEAKADYEVMIQYSQVDAEPGNIASFSNTGQTFLPLHILLFDLGDFLLRLPMSER